MNTIKYISIPFKVVLSQINYKLNIELQVTLARSKSNLFKQVLKLSYYLKRISTIYVKDLIVIVIAVVVLDIIDLMIKLQNDKKVFAF